MRLTPMLKVKASSLAENPKQETKRIKEKRRRRNQSQ